jgi:heme-degrading monooxygenase HmoA
MSVEAHDGAGVEAEGPLVLVNVFVPKAGRLDDFLALQRREIARLAPEARRHGWRGNRTHRALDGGSAIVVTRFDSAERQRSWARTAAFAAHLAAIAPLVESVTSTRCRLVDAAGEF